MKPTKYYSNKQESMIASYLGWKLVSASGARPFNKGDVYSPCYLGECKTHTSIVKDVVINNHVWTKISNEAMSAKRKPVLFIDNGSQNISDTWCVIPYRLLSVNNRAYVILDINETANHIRINHQAAKQLLGSTYYTVFAVCGELVAFMNLEYFKELIE